MLYFQITILPYQQQPTETNTIYTKGLIVFVATIGTHNTCVKKSPRVTFGNPDGNERNEKTVTMEKLSSICNRTLNEIIGATLINNQYICSYVCVTYFIEIVTVDYIAALR